MDYDFYFLCSDQLNKLDKRLHSFKKVFIKEYMIALNVINNSEQNTHREELKQEIDDLLSDFSQKCCVSFRQTFNKVEEVLKKYL